MVVVVEAMVVEAAVGVFWAESVGSAVTVDGGSTGSAGSVVEHPMRIIAMIAIEPVSRIITGY